MCGIFALLNNEYFSKADIQQEFEKGKHRGHEFSKLTSNLIMKTDFGFHRLSINGLNEASNEPLIIDDIVLICNGVIYNLRRVSEDFYFNLT